MRQTKTIPIILAVGLVASFAAAAIVADRMHVVKKCKDVRIAMDGAYDAVVESSSLRSKTALTVFQSHNRKKIKVDTFEVKSMLARDGNYYYYNDQLRLAVANNANPKAGRQTASLQGNINGEKVKIEMGCTF